MTLSRGRDLFAIPGPSTIPDRVLRAMHRATPNIYEGELIGLTETVTADLKRLARTEAQAAIYICNGHGAWEAAIANTLAPGDRVLVPATGRFAKGWADMAARLGIETEILDFGTAAPADPAAITTVLKADPAIRAVLAVHTDTSSSVLNDIPAIRAAIDAANHPALLMADCIASFACDRFEMDAWGVDLAVTACQKGLMTPPGLGFVFAGDKALAARRALLGVSPYWDILPRVEPAIFYQRFCGTAPTHHLYGLREALDMILEEGLEAVWTRHATFARLIHAAVDRWAETGDLRLNVPDPAHRSNAVTTIRTAPGDGDRLRAWCDAEAGLTLGVGLGLEGPGSGTGDDIFRIGHMGHLNPPMILGTLAVTEAGLKALGIPHGEGAVEVAARLLARTAPGPG